MKNPIKNAELVKVVATLDDKFPEPLEGEYVLAGRSNVGKSSFINSLVGGKIAYVSKNPGKTRTINYYLVSNKFYIVDLPGYGYARTSQKDRENWRKVIDQYFNKRMWNIKKLFVLIDSRHNLMESDQTLLEWISELDLNIVVVLTKVDKLNNTELKKTLDYFEKELEVYPIERIIPFSSITGRGKEDVYRIIFDEQGGKV